MKGVGITSSMWRCGTSCAWIWNNCTSSSTSPSVVYARSRTWFKPSLLKLDWSLRKLDRVCAPVSNCHAESLIIRRPRRPGGRRRIELRIMGYSSLVGVGHGFLSDHDPSHDLRMFLDTIV